jgi:uncharacterized protein YuzE
MTVSIGPYRFDSAIYDSQGDVLYLRVGESREAATTFGTPEGHAVRFDDDGNVIGITIVNAKWLLERHGKLTVTVASRVEATADEIGPALTAA